MRRHLRLVAPAAPQRSPVDGERDALVALINLLSTGAEVDVSGDKVRITFELDDATFERLCAIGAEREDIEAGEDGE